MRVRVRVGVRVGEGSRPQRVSGWERCVCSVGMYRHHFLTVRGEYESTRISVLTEPDAQMFCCDVNNLPQPVCLQHATVTCSSAAQTQIEENWHRSRGAVDSDLMSMSRALEPGIGTGTGTCRCSEAQRHYQVLLHNCPPSCYAITPPRTNLR